jgi:hypothetical protein
VNFGSSVTLGALAGQRHWPPIDNEINAPKLKPVTSHIIIPVSFVMAIDRVSTLLRPRLV